MPIKSQDKSSSYSEYYILIILYSHPFSCIIISPDLSNKVRGLPYGVRSIFTPRGRDMITSIDNFENDESYVCSSMRHQARGIDPSRILQPPKWQFSKPSSGLKEYNVLLQVSISVVAWLI